MLARAGLLVSLAAVGAHAHCGWTGFYVNGVSVGDGTAMRMSNVNTEATFPLKYNSEDVACNVNGKNGVSRTAQIKDGDTLSFECRSNMPDVTNALGDGPIAVGHKGPCAIYAKKVDDATTDPGAGPGWFKLWEDGYDEGTGKWCNERFIEAGGFLSVKLPEGLQGGDYLFRPELLALHAAHDGDPQFYAGCAQVHLESTGDLVAKDTVSIPGWVDTSTPGVFYDLYKYPTMDLPYPIPGPRVAELVPGISKASTQSTGLKPQGCIIENSNWCGKEVPSYSTQDGCWASAKNCWDQADKCWATAGPTGGHGCETFGNYCESLSALCESRNWNGPPNAGSALGPAKRTISPSFWGSGAPTVGEGSPSTGNSGSDTSDRDEPVPSSEASTPSTGYASGGDDETGSGVSAPEEADEAGSSEAPAPTPTPSPEAENYDVVVVTVTEYTTVTVDAYVTAR